jgi:CDGSH iron-sulfur domain-containing protein 3
MNTSKPSGDIPIDVELKEGQTYYWCACGLSDTQPFCNGAHKGTDIKPHAFSVTKSRRQHLCTCKATANKPFCDGTHLEE